MYARVVTAQGRPVAFKSIDIYKNEVVPRAKNLPGYKGTLLLSNQNTGKFISISLWETKEDMKSNESKGHLRDQAAKFATVVAAPPTMESFEVIQQL